MIKALYIKTFYVLSYLNGRSTFLYMIYALINSENDCLLHCWIRIGLKTGTAYLQGDGTRYAGLMNTWFAIPNGSSMVVTWNTHLKCAYFDSHWTFFHYANSLTSSHLSIHHDTTPFAPTTHGLFSLHIYITLTIQIHLVCIHSTCT